MISSHSGPTFGVFTNHSSVRARGKRLSSQSDDEDSVLVESINGREGCLGSPRGDK